MNVVVTSAHRNNAHDHGRYFAQLTALHAALTAYGWSMRVVAVWGDSARSTPRSLLNHAAGVSFDVEVVGMSHGGPMFGSTEDPERLRALSKVGNAMLDAVREDDDVLVYVESDLVWSADTMRCLIHATTMAEFGERGAIFAPLIFAGDHFYDTFVFRGLDGERFSPFPPYHRSMSLTEHTEVASAGSCLVMPARIARDKRCRMTDNALLDFCAEARRADYSIYVLPYLKVNHP